MKSTRFWGVYSVWFRHASIYYKTLLVNCLLPISEPILYLLAFGYGLGALVPEINYQGNSITYLQFIAPGMIAVGVLFQAFFEGAYGTYVRLHFQKTWHALLTAPLDFRDVFFGDLLWAATRGAIAGIVTGLVAVVWGIFPLHSLISSVPIILCGSLLFGALGMVAAGVVRTIDQLNIPIFLLVTPMFVLCGTYFPRSNLPTGMRLAAEILPLSSLIDLLRWNIAVPAYWPGHVLWLIVWTVVTARIAWRSIYPQLFPG